jgi:protein-tyrosine phosphatase
MNEIITNLFQGDQIDAHVAAGYGNVDYIVYVGQELPHELAFGSVIPVVHIPLKDGVDKPEKWWMVYQILFNLLNFTNHLHTDAKVLVACREGKSRSPMVALLYLVKTECFATYNEACKFVREKVPCFQPEQNMADMVKKMLEEQTNVVY